MESIPATQEAIQQWLHDNMRVLTVAGHSFFDNKQFIEGHRIDTDFLMTMSTGD